MTFLSGPKQSGPLRVYHLIAGVGLVTGSVWLGLAEWLAHTIIDEVAVGGGTTFAQDQASQIAGKAVWLAYPPPVRNAAAWIVYLALVALTFAAAALAAWWPN
ncbi:hypothetical protein [Rhizobium sp. P32RR-XVIII]|uniref:hypothetical protein n=1 Tax=Rhizobium sp. P32RR-XVIII TaxID=2726738 RepID=UPI001FEDCD13|nr:hypothetical protein [Rhizobium sp. P32RR-XVIII]